MLAPLFGGELSNLDHEKKNKMFAAMQQEATVSWEPIVRTAPIRPWEIVVALILFVCLIYGVVWSARRRSEKGRGSLDLLQRGSRDRMP